MPRIATTDRYQLTWRQPGTKACVGRSSFTRRCAADLFTQAEHLMTLGYEVTITPPAPIEIDAPIAMVNVIDITGQ